MESQNNQPACIKLLDFKACHETTLTVTGIKTGTCFKHRIEGPKINPHIHSHLFFTKVPKAFIGKQDNPFSKWRWQN